MGKASRVKKRDKTASNESTTEFSRRCAEVSRVGRGDRKRADIHHRKVIDRLIDEGRGAEVPAVLFRSPDPAGAYIALESLLAEIHIQLTMSRVGDYPAGVSQDAVSNCWKFKERFRKTVDFTNPILAAVTFCEEQWARDYDDAPKLFEQRVPDGVAALGRLLFSPRVRMGKPVLAMEVARYVELSAGEGLAVGCANEPPYADIQSNIAFVLHHRGWGTFKVAMAQHLKLFQELLSDPDMVPAPKWMVELALMGTYAMDRFEALSGKGKLSKTPGHDAVSANDLMAKTTISPLVTTRTIRTKPVAVLESSVRTELKGVADRRGLDDMCPVAMRVVAAAEPQVDDDSPMLIDELAHWVTSVAITFSQNPQVLTDLNARAQLDLVERPSKLGI